MLNDLQPESRPMSANRKLWLGFGGALLLVLAYVGWVFYSRWHENSQINQEVKTEQEQKEQKQAADTRTPFPPARKHCIRGRVERENTRCPEPD